MTRQLNVDRMRRYSQRAREDRSEWLAKMDAAHRPLHESGRPFICSTCINTSANEAGKTIEKALRAGLVNAGRTLMR